ncbi:hypothetical protein [Mycolicibacterium wolinskyi]|uniref:hypothetical protein n=1 Tax=Mycolicibacterium wolinskyi TaxID=59750 RepID=UPI00391799F0
MDTINKTQYDLVAREINQLFARCYSSSQTGWDLHPRVSVLAEGDDGYNIVMNDDAHTLAARKGYVQDMFYAADYTFVVGDDDFILLPDAKLDNVFTLAR